MATESETFLSTGRPKFSVVVPLFRTEKYLGELLDSFDAQHPGDYETEFIFVDDGSDDASGDIAAAWLDRTGHEGQLIRQENGGVSRARNTGLAAATGDWVTFPDSDDLLGQAYFAEAAATIKGAGSKATLLSANVWYYDEVTGARRDRHHLRHKFRAADPTVDMEERPTFLQTQAASAFFRLDIIREHDITFVDGLRVAEDAIFAATYLLHAPRAVMAPLRKAVYQYRRRGNASSAANSYTTNPDFYFGRFERGYLPLLELAQSTGRVPRWLEYLIIYDLSWYFPREMERDRKANHLSDAEKTRALELLRSVLEQISEPAILNYRLTPVKPEVRALMLTLSGRSLPQAGTVRLSRNVAGAFEISYLYQGELPTEVIESDGRPVQPVAAKTTKLDYFGQQLLHERILRLPELTDVGLVLNGRPFPLQKGNYDLGSSEVTAAGARKRPAPPAPKPEGPTQRRKAVVNRARKAALGRARKIAFRGAVELVCFTQAPIPAPTATKKGVALRRKRYLSGLHKLARSAHFGKKFAGAWLIMDRLDSARDNGEYLYEYLRTERPDINAWFVLRKNSPEWERLSKLGFRLLAYRGVEHQAALLNAAVVASSQLDVEIVRPIPLDFYPRKRRPWRFAYLQHGVLQHDLAHWFNGKSIDLLTTASVDEQDSIVRDGSSYKLTSDSVVLTGFPRHDDVVKRAEHHPYDERSVVLIAPTWRNSLFLPKSAFAARRTLRDPFLETDYGRNWMGLLRHPALQRLADEQNAQIIYLPHPNFRDNTPGVTYPEHVTVIESTPDLHELMASARVTVTDYSSIFFDAALAGSKIVYFQFDQDEFLNGSHTYLPGYWDYEKHGFGPVATELDEAARWTTEAYDATDGQWPDVYRERVARTLPRADGESAKRITDLIENKFRL